MTEREGQDEKVLVVEGDIGTTTRDMRLRFLAEPRNDSG